MGIQLRGDAPARHLLSAAVCGLLARISTLIERLVDHSWRDQRDTLGSRSGRDRPDRSASSSAGREIDLNNPQQRFPAAGPVAIEK